MRERMRLAEFRDFLMKESFRKIWFCSEDQKCGTDQSYAIRFDSIHIVLSPDTVALTAGRENYLQFHRIEKIEVDKRSFYTVIEVFTHRKSYKIVAS